MISGRRVPDFLLLALIACNPLLVQAQWGVDKLLAAIAAEGPRETTFIERKTVSIIDHVMESRGVLRFAPPDRLEKITQAPFKERIEAHGDRVTVQREGRSSTEISLQQSPPWRAIVEGFRSTLGGNLQTLKQHFAVTLDGTEANWQLLLTPLDTRLARVIEVIRIEGAGSQPLRFIIREKAGDESTMELGE